MSSNTLPRYQAIANELRQAVTTGIYKAGECLPTEAELSQQFSVNRHTLRRSIQILKQEGLLTSDQGRGTFVTTKLIHYPIRDRISYTQLLQEQGISVQRQTLSITEIVADDLLAKKLKLGLGDPVVLWQRLGLADGYPLSLGNSYFPGDRLPGILEHCQHYVSITQMFQECYGYQHRRQQTRISAQAPTLKDAERLAISPKTPVLISESININQTSDIIEYGLTRFRGDRMEVIIED
jgi:GntR family phosphonate transport system transcriptional regulator